MRSARLTTARACKHPFTFRFAFLKSLSFDACKHRTVTELARKIIFNEEILSLCGERHRQAASAVVKPYWWGAEMQPSA